MTRALVLAAASAVVLSASARGQSADPAARPIRFGIAGGVAIPAGDFKTGGDAAALKRDFKQGVAGQGYVEFRAPGTPLGFRAGVSFNRFKASDATFTSTGPTGTPRTTTLTGDYSQVLAGLANVTLQLPTGPIRPYAIAGIGAFELKNTAAVQITPGAGVIAAPDESTTSFGIDGGAGVLLRLGGIEAFAEARLANVYTKQDKFANLKTVQFVPITFGLSF